MDDLIIDENLTIPGHELSWTAVTSGGPGGQNVNKVATKVQLRWQLAESTALPDWARERLITLAGRKIDQAGNLLISSSTTRSQERNLELARERLAGLIREALARPKHRRPTRPSRAAKRRRIEDKRRLSDKKVGRRRPDHE
ncbi:MAG TPA: alternative ribosome rescue aminoacyl-tRNA hydrolase ArfB [Enhygromyxa sp.]|nr:alternative ribosome rescue aminoacyl-tRNA hydrolase ArfB [Enhygromyxa sp.]